MSSHEHDADNPSIDREYEELVDDLTRRWPESHPAPSLARIEALLDLLGHPERTAPVIQLTGTNGKGSTAIMIEALLRSLGLRTGRFSSPHLSDLTERITIDGAPISHARFVALWHEIEPYVALVDDRMIDDVEMTFFEVVTGLAYAAFADAPVDVMIMEVGLGGSWDATNVADADVAVVCPIDLDHMHLLGDTLAKIAGEKAGIIKPGARAVIADQQPEAAQVLAERCIQVGAVASWEGKDFALLDRQPAVGGQVLRLQSGGGALGDVHLPLFGEHMARNAAIAVAAVEALVGRPLEQSVVEDGFANVVAPARLELVRRSPAVVIDTAHNPHGVRATLRALEEAFAFRPLIAVVAMMADKQVDAVLELLADTAAQIVVTTLRTPRAISASELGQRATGIFGAERVSVAPTMADALDRGLALADEAGPGAGVVVIGSVIAAGEARDLVRGAEPDPSVVTGAVVTPTPDQVAALLDDGWVASE